jgi:serpin B
MSTIGEDEKSIIESNNLLAIDLYFSLAREDKNIFFSPFSILTALFMAYAGARKNTAVQMERALHIKLQQDRFHQVFRQFSPQFDASEDYELSIANALSTGSDRHILDSYKDFIKNVYGGEFLEFSAGHINNWISKKTRGRIKKIIDPSSLGTTLLILLNAVYFKGVWQFQFKKNNTSDSDFYLPSGKTVQVPMMRQVALLPYDENPSMQILEMAYRGRMRDISMVVFLPKERNGLSRFEEIISAKLLQQNMSNLREREVEVFLPRYSIEAGYKLNNAFRGMGMVDAFTTDADFSGMTDNPDGLMFEKILHKATIDVDEKGTVAAAATAMMMTLGSYNPPPVFRADHPFLFLLKDVNTGIILFIGKISNPVESYKESGSSIPFIKRLVRRL